VNIELVTLEKIRIGWKIVFKVNLTAEESSKCNLESIESVGDYQIEKDFDQILFSCDFDAGELKEKETIDQRLDLIKSDIENLTNSCLN